MALDAAEIIKNTDDAMNRAHDQIIEWKVVNQEPGKGDAKIMAFTSSVMGPKTLTSFSAPADLKGTRVLVLGRQQMYIFLPAYNKVRRVASHTTQQGFMGTTFSFDDMNTSRFGDIYDAKVLTQDGQTATLELTPKVAGEAPYARAEVVMDLTIFHPLVMKYYNDKGAHVKTETRSKYECNDTHNVCLGGVLRMDDHTRDGAWTELQRTGWQLNTGIEDDVFSTRNLQRGE
jgi:hypothetical protein